MHTIKLRGPWQVSVLGSDTPTPLYECKINVRQSDDWRTWIDSMLLEQDGELPQLERVVFRRSFNWPNPQPLPASVKLAIDSVLKPVVFLNENTIDVPRVVKNVAVEVLSCLNDSNVLILEFDLDEQAIDHFSIESIELQIEG